MSTTTPSRVAPAQVPGGPERRAGDGRGHLRLVPPVDADLAAARARSRAAHPAGKGLAAGGAVNRGAGGGATRRPHSTGTARKPGSTRPAPLRLTARGRLVLRALVVVLMLATMAAAGLALARGAAAADGPVPAVVVHTHVVLPGETLWGIARQVAPQEDPRDVVARIVEFNALQSASVQAGQRLALPPGLPVAR